MPFIVLDTETTSKYRQKARVLQIAAVVDRYGKLVDKFSSYSNPGPDVLADPDIAASLAVIGITIEQISKAPPERRVKNRFAKFLAKCPRATLTSFNVDYDRTVLHTGGWPGAEHKWGPCIMLAAQKVMAAADALPHLPNGGYKLPTLDEAAQFFLKDIQPRKHDALEDAILAHRIWKEATK